MTRYDSEEKNLNCGRASSMDQIVLLHCSDVHFGEIPANNQFHRLWPMKNQNAHDLQLCLGLKPALEDVRDLTGLPDSEEIRIIVSGDLTATGGDKEFLVGHSFLRSHYRVQREPTSDVTGFDIRANRKGDDLPLRVVPGNHDHWWGSKWMWGNNPNIRGSHFRDTPWLIPWQSGALVLEVGGLDSCAGVDPKQRNKRQIGKLDLSTGGEVERLKGLLRDSDKAGLPKGAKARVRTIVVHHSLAYAGGLWGALKLDDASKRALLELAEEFRMAAYLTGHTHDFFFDPPFDTLPNGSGKVHELRSASTLQGPHGRHGPEPPGFWAHKIWLDGGQARWTSWRYYWNGASRFEPKDRKKPCVEFSTP
jgi:hypothetical protein